MRRTGRSGVRGVGVGLLLAATMLSTWVARSVPGQGVWHLVLLAVIVTAGGGAVLATLAAAVRMRRRAVPQLAGSSTLDVVPHRGGRRGAVRGTAIAAPAVSPRPLPSSPRYDGGPDHVGARAGVRRVTGGEPDGAAPRDDRGYPVDRAPGSRAAAALAELSLLSTYPSGGARPARRSDTNGPSGTTS